MDDDIRDILDGKNVPVDLALDQQSAEDQKLIPVVKRNICYICCSLLFDSHGKVLLVQEAKQSCYGQWYLPAGRLEPGETILDGAKREVKEEAGLDCDLTTLLCVELNGLWMRFTFTGRITGGNLKTLKEKDSESLQAQFFNPDELPQQIRPTKLRSDSSNPSSQGGSCILRSNDILNLIALGQKYNKEMTHPISLPVIHPHKYISYRFVIMDRSTTSDSMHILKCTEGGKSHIPVRLGHVSKGVHVFVLVASVVNAAFSIRLSECSFQIFGVLGIEHRGTGEEEDGICITLLTSLNIPEGHELPRITSSDYSWCPVTDSYIRARLHDGCNKKIVPVL